MIVGVILALLIYLIDAIPLPELLQRVARIAIIVVIVVVYISRACWVWSSSTRERKSMRSTPRRSAVLWRDQCCRRRRRRLRKSGWHQRPLLELGRAVLLFADNSDAETGTDRIDPVTTGKVRCSDS